MSVTEKKMVQCCDKCDSTNVLMDAYAKWDTLKQDWALNSTHENTVCEGDCGGECSIHEREATAEELAEAEAESPLLALEMQNAVLRAALSKIVDRSPDKEPDPEDYDDMESAYSNGFDVATFEVAEIARSALADAPSADAQTSDQCVDDLVDSFDLSLESLIDDIETFLKVRGGWRAFVDHVRAAHGGDELGGPDQNEDSGMRM